MSVFWIAWKSIKHRGFASLLTILSMTLGVMLVVSVLTIHGVVQRSFSNNGEVGYDLIIGAKGGDLDLALNSVYYLSKPVETIPYEYYLACKDQAFREQEFQRSIHFKVHRTRDVIREVSAAHLELNGLGGPIDLANELSLDVYDEISLAETGMFKDGLFAQLGYIDWVVPILLGDYFDEYRVVATTPEFFDDRLLESLPEDENEPSEPAKTYEELDKITFEFESGRAFEHFNEDHAYFEAVVGWRVARESGVKIGDRIQITHGVPASEGGDEALHNQKYTIVGILKRMNRPEDRVAFVNMEGFFLMNDHANFLMTEDEMDAIFAEKGAEAFEQEFDKIRVPLPLEQRRISALLTASATPGGVNFYAGSIQRATNKGKLENSTVWTDYAPPRLQKAASAIYPIAEINKLFVNIVTPIQTVLLVLTLMICVVSGISILVSIYNSMSDRRHEIAVMRALGANRVNILTIILVESSLLGIFGLVFGWFAGHGLIGLASPYFDQFAGVSVGFFDFASPLRDYIDVPYLPTHLSAEFFLLPIILLLSILVGIVPAIVAYRTDVSQNLGK